MGAWAEMGEPVLLIARVAMVVLVGLQLGSRSLKELKSSLDAVGYPYSDESANPAYQLFLR